ncbi:MAG: primosomal protein N', partial [Lachnospiraceae bacterium]|nr:primosomal protein N' [Lachnospiraceae bacterium]
KTGHEDIVASFINKEADILIGTQMIVKGHDFPDVTLVGILAADMSLFANDYHAGENTFELLTQAAGRAGRGEIPGEVVIQTYNPDNYAIKNAAAHDYESFYNEEIGYRSLLKYPPTGNLLNIMIQSDSEEKIERLSKDIADVIRKANDKRVVILGPVDATIKKINNVYRKVIYLKAREYATLVEWKNNIEEYRRNTDYRDGSVGFDFNPTTNI